MEKVWILFWNNCYEREIYGVYISEDLANEAADSLTRIIGYEDVDSYKLKIESQEILTEL